MSEWDTFISAHFKNRLELMCQSVDGDEPMLILITLIGEGVTQHLSSVPHRSELAKDMSSRHLLKRAPPMLVISLLRQTQYNKHTCDKRKEEDDTLAALQGTSGLLTTFSSESPE